MSVYFHIYKLVIIFYAKMNKNEKFYSLKSHRT